VGSLTTPGARQDIGVTTVSFDAGQRLAALPWPYGELPPQAVLSSPTVTRIRSVQPPARHDKAPAQAGDVAQARLFDAILQGEIAELEQLAESAERSWLQQRVRGAGDDTLPEELVRLGERVAEAHRLLRALRARFSHERAK
jgi:hypothetical protein